jgi:hypothetical protein
MVNERLEKILANPDSIAYFSEDLTTFPDAPSWTAITFEDLRNEEYGDIMVTLQSYDELYDEDFNKYDTIILPLQALWKAHAKIEELLDRKIDDP